MSDRFRILDASATHVGLVRSENEDSLVSAPQAGVWIVADGMGGHVNGKFASQSIVDAVAEAVRWADTERPWEGVADAIHQANRQIFAQSRELGQQMGSTVVALIFCGKEFVVMWAGDSRAYLFRDGDLFRLTRDHTQVELMLERGLLSAEEAIDHPMQHVLARAVGVGETLELEAIRDVILPRDVFLLCSDGLYGVVDEAQIADILREYDTQAGEPLIAASLAAGAPDNVTVTLVAANEPTLLVLDGTEQ